MQTISIASGWTYAVRKKRGVSEFELRRLETRRGSEHNGWHSPPLEDGSRWEFVTRTDQRGRVRVLAVNPDGGLRGTFEFDGVELAQERGSLVVKRHFVDSRPPLFGPDGSTL